MILHTEILNIIFSPNITCALFGSSFSGLDAFSACLAVSRKGALFFFAQQKLVIFVRCLLVHKKYLDEWPAGPTV